MNLLRNFLMKFFISFCIALLLCQLKSYSIWLNMRIHTNYLFYSSGIIILLLMYFFNFKNYTAFYFFEIIILVLMALKMNYDKIFYDLKEIFFLNSNIYALKPIMIYSIIIINILYSILFVQYKNIS